MIKKGIAFYTVDLCPQREHLMPWRTILEVAKHMEIDGHNICIINACYNINERTDYVWNNISIYAIKPGYSSLSDFIRSQKISTLFMEIKWRDGLKNWEHIKKLNCKKIGYFSGGIYNFLNAYKLLQISDFKLARNYLIESLVPKTLLKNKLKQAHFCHNIGLTDYTTKIATRCGIPNTTKIYPGKDSFEKLTPDYNIIKKYQLYKKKFFLFTGAPIAYRGASELLKAIDLCKNSDIHIVMLIRMDKGTITTEFDSILSQLKYRQRVTIIYEKLTRNQLRAFYESAYYAILPFIVIPSEIPLTYFEILSCGTPIISFKNGGTTEYLKNGLILSKLGSNNLAKCLSSTWFNDSKRKEKSESAIEIMKMHPTWDEVAKQWEKFI